MVSELMKILVAVHYWPPHIGGIETVAYQQVKRLSKIGHFVSVITSRTAGAHDDPADSTVQVHRFAVWNFLEKFGIPYPICNPVAFFKHLSLIKNHDVVLVHNHSFMNSFFTCLGAKVCGRPVVLLQHTPKIEYNFPWNIAQKMADLVFGKFVIRYSDTVLAVSEHTASYIEDIAGIQNTIILSNGIDTHRFSPVDRPTKNEYKKSKSIDPSAVVYLTVRRLVKRNGVEVLIKAFSELELSANVFLIIVGNGSQMGRLKSIAESNNVHNILFAGQVDEVDLTTFYQMADVFVLPSISGEGFGLSLLEAMSTGLPCIVSADGGHTEYFQEGKQGYKFKNGNAKHLTQLMRRLSLDSATRECMGKIGFETAQTFSWERNVDQLQDVLVRQKLSD